MLAGKRYVAALAVATVTFGSVTTTTASARSAAADPPEPARRTVLVHLRGDGAADVSAQVERRTRGSNTAKAATARQAVLDRREQVTDAAADLLADARRIDPKAVKLFEISNALPGVAINAAPAAIAELAQRTDVVKVSTITAQQPASGAASAEEISKVVDVWQNTGVTGEGVRVGVVDTGVEYSHRTFGGLPSLGVDAVMSDGVDPDWRSKLPALGQVKIIGGVDLVGNDYNVDASVGKYQPVPHPDADPRDCHGHGTQVAGIVGGYGAGVSASADVFDLGYTFTGPYTAAATAGLATHPGMAPKAQLFPIKVFGCMGSSDAVAAGLDRALDPNGDGNFDDKLDIVALPLVAPGYPADDPQNDVVDALVRAGVLVVSATGNSGDTTDATGAGGSAVRALTVAAGGTTNGQGWIYSQSSRGTHGAPGVVKPDVVAPGLDVNAPRAWGLYESSTATGTSYAAAHAAGLAALLKAVHKDWSPEQLKAGVMNTAGHDVFQYYDPNAGTTLATPRRYGPARAGAGFVDAAAAVDNAVLVYTSDLAGAVSASFGVVEAPIGGGPITRTRTMTVQNTGATDVTLSLSYSATVTQPGVSYAVSPASVTVAATSSATATVTMTIDPSALRHTIDPTMRTSQPYGEHLNNGFEPVPAVDTGVRQFLPDASGLLLVTPTGKPALRVPVYGAAKPVTDLTASYSETTSALTLSGHGIAATDVTKTDQYQSYLSVLELGATSAQLPACATGGTVEGCTSSQTGSGGDLQYVGAGASRAATTGGRLWFGISTWGNSAVLGRSVVPYVNLDVNDDATYDYRVEVSFWHQSDVLMASTYRLSDNKRVGTAPVNFLSGEHDTNVFDSNVMLLPVDPATIGVAAGATSVPLTYEVGTRSSYGSASTGEIDHVGPIRFDAARPAVAVSDDQFVSTGIPLIKDVSGAKVTLTVREPGASALTLHLHNASGTRAQAVQLGRPLPTLAISKPKSVNYGEKARLGARLLDGSGKPVSGATLALYQRAGSRDPWAKVRAVTTGRDGSAVTTVGPKATTLFQWRFGGDSLRAPATSATSSVTVRQVVSAAAHRTRVAPGQVFKVYGRLAPAKANRTVYLQRLSGTRWVTVAKTTTRRQVLPDGRTSTGYVFNQRIRTAGVYYFRTVIRSYGGLATGVSKRVGVRVR